MECPNCHKPVVEHKSELTGVGQVFPYLCGQCGFLVKRLTPGKVEVLEEPARMGRQKEAKNATTKKSLVRFRYREHRGLLSESLATTTEMTANALEEHLFSIYGKGLVNVKKYGNGIDVRCGWDTHIVTHNGNAVGFTDGSVAL